MKCNIPHLHYSKYTKHTTEKYFWQNTKKTLTLQSLSQSGCSTVGSAPRSGRGGRKFESSHPDIKIFQLMQLEDFFFTDLIDVSPISIIRSVTV